MTFLISLCTALVFSYICGERLKKNPLPFYVGAVILGLISVLTSWFINDIEAAPFVSEMLKKVINPMISGGALSGALFVLVMFAGVFAPGTYPAKTFMPLRAPLSIIGGILAICHAVSYGKSYVLRLFNNPASFDGYTVFYFAASVVLLLIMIPLFVTSFKKIRRKMDGKKWKKLQRWAYVFYGLLYLHVMLIAVKKAFAGVQGYDITALIYSFVFISYALCRISKALCGKNKKLLMHVQFMSAVFAFIAVAVFSRFMPSAEDGPILAEASAAPAGVIEESGTPLLAAPEDNSENLSMQEDKGNPASIDKPESENYVDGVYEGSGIGMNGPISVVVTIKGGLIESVEIREFDDDDDYFSRDKDGAVMEKRILEAQSSEVDAIAGATYSSEGYKDAVKDALSKALPSGE